MAAVEATLGKVSRPSCHENNERQPPTCPRDHLRPRRKEHSCPRQLPFHSCGQRRTVTPRRRAACFAEARRHHRRHTHALTHDARSSRRASASKSSSSEQAPATRPAEHARERECALPRAGARCATLRNATPRGPLKC
eukprot:scaffold1809_cov386-Prasinococcus_capsulatus_cf.AAC.54